MKTLQTTLIWTITVLFGAFISVGCGSSVVKSIITLTTNASAVAFQKGDGDWNTSFESTQVVTDGKRYTFEADGKYKVALKCTDKSYYVMAFHATEDNNLSFSCLTLHANLMTKISGTITDSVDGAKTFVVASDTQYTTVVNANNYNFQTINRDKSDILAVSMTNDVKRFIALRDQKIDNAHKTFNINFTTANSASVVPKAFNVTAPTLSRMVLVTDNGTYFTTTLGTKWYYPTGQLLESDYYLLASRIPASHTYRVQTIQATRMEQKDITIDLSDLKPMNGLTYAANVISGLNGYIPGDTAQPLRGYVLDLEGAGLYQYHVAVSKGYLEEADDYVLDDLSTVAGFGGSWDGAGATSVEATAIMYDGFFSTIIRRDSTLRLNDFEDFPFLKNTIIEAANQKIK
jgi:hypothetical protein